MEIKDEKETEVIDEIALDKEIEESINKVKAGNEPEVKAPIKPEEGKEETPTAPKEGEPATPKEEVDKKEGEYEFRIPNKGKFESDESYEKRIELMDLVKRRKLAKTEDQREELSKQIKTTKNQIKTLNGTDKITNPLNQAEVETEKKEEIDEALKADQERLRQLGGATKDDIKNIIQEERTAADVKNTLDKFVERHAELKDADAREVFFDFVDQNFNWANKTGKELMTVLELARESMFKPSETLQERILKAANVQEKVNAMQFPGGTVAKQTYSPEMKKSIDELVSTGMSEEKALELLSE